jgi:hypothetical protein
LGRDGWLAWLARRRLAAGSCTQADVIDNLKTQLPLILRQSETHQREGFQQKNLKVQSSGSPGTPARWTPP